jgi:hypothetical protein
VTTDGGLSWERAEIERADFPHAWQSWRYRWNAMTTGHYELCCRATDASGDTQPLDQNWTARGMGNNMVQRVHVQVV